MINVTAADFDQNSYQETDLKTDGQIKAGDDIYTIITDERWSLLIPLSEKQAANLKERTSIRVKFLKDDLSADRRHFQSWRSMGLNTVRLILIRD